MKKRMLTFYIFLAFLSGISANVFAQPANDDICNATVLYVDSLLCSGTPNANNIGATAQPNEPFGSCSAGFANTQSVWFTFTGDSTGFVDIQVPQGTGSLGVVAVAVYTTPDTCSNFAGLTEVACGITGFGGGAVISNMAAPLDSVFYIQVTGTFFQQEGDFCIDIVSSVALPPVTNDSICNATVLQIGDSCDLSSPNGNTAGAGIQAGEPSGSCFFPGGLSNTVWYTFVGPDSGNTLLTFTDITIGGAQLAVYELPLGDSCADLQNLLEVECTFVQGSQSIGVDTDSGVVYFVQVASFAGFNGTFCLEMSEAALLDNDQPCSANLLPVDGTTYTYSSIGATVDSGETALAPPEGSDPGEWIENAIDGTVWFKFVAPAGGAVEVQLCHAGTDYDTQVAVYSAGDCSDYSTFTLLAANDDKDGDCQLGNQYASELQSCFTPGDTFYIMVDGFAGEQGMLEISLTPVQAPALSITLASSPQDCPGAATGSIQVNTTGGLGNFSYDWSNGDSSETLSGVLPGIYSVIVTDACGNSVSDSATVGTAPLLIADAGTDQTICIGDTVTIGGAPTGSGGKPFQTESNLYGIVSDFGSTGIFSHPLNQPAQANTYAGITGDINGGDFTPSGLLAVDGDTDMLVRIDTASGSVTNIGMMTPSSGHTWTGVAYNAANDTLYGVSTNGLNGRLYFIDPATGVATIGPFLSTATQPLWLAIGPDGEAYVQDAATDSIFSVNLKTGETVSIASPGFTTAAVFRLDADVDKSTGNLYFFDEGTTGATGLLVLNTTTNTVNSIGTLGVDGEARLLAISGSNPRPYNYSWVPVGSFAGDTLEQTMVFPDSSTRYVVAVTDACGTTASDTVQVDANVQFTLSDGVTGGVGTGGASVTIISGTPPYSYSWNTGDTTASVSGVASGEYEVTVTDGDGCTGTKKIQIWATAIDDLAGMGISRFQLYPNPAIRDFTLEISLQQPQNIELTLFDMRGKPVWKVYENQITTLEKRVEPGELPAGVYLLNISTEKGTTSQRVIIR